MHPAPSLLEAPPTHDESRSPAGPPSRPGGGGGEGGAQHPLSPHRRSPPTPTQPPLSPPLRKDTNSSISTQATTATSATGTTSLSVESTNTSYSAETSPTPHQSIFSVKDGSDVSNTRRPNRRRTGPLSQQQREKAALIRKLGACGDCRRRRVACHPSHHNMTWEDAVKKYHRNHSPTIPDIAPLAGGRRISPAPMNNHNHQNHQNHQNHHSPQNHQGGHQNHNHSNHVNSVFRRDSTDAMEIDSGPTGPPGQPLTDSRLRTPLPAGKPLTIPGIDSLKTELQTNAAKIFSLPHRGRYTAAQALLLSWQDDEKENEISPAIQELAEVLDKQYRYTFQRQKIPSTSDECKSPWRWLSPQITAFTEDRDQRDVLKILYYNGHSTLDRNGEMVLASSKDRDKASTIRWSGIQQILEEAFSDVLIIMDAAYYPSSNMERKQGVLELIAAAGSEKMHSNMLSRGVFTRALTEELRNKARGPNQLSLSAVELHAKLLSMYPRMMLDRRSPPDRDSLTSYPSPLHLQISSNPRLPSIQLTRLHRTSLPFGVDLTGPQVHLSIRLKDEEIDIESWTEWLRMMPEGIKDVKVDGPFPMPMVR